MCVQALVTLARIHNKYVETHIVLVLSIVGFTDKSNTTDGLLKITALIIALQFYH